MSAEIGNNLDLRSKEMEDIRKSAISNFDKEVIQKVVSFFTVETDKLKKNMEAGTIFKVPTMTRASNRPDYDPKNPSITRGSISNDYDPMVVSIGPYHWGKPELQPMESVKMMYLLHLLERNKETSLQKYAEVIANLVPEARGHYTEPLDKKLGSSEAFITMMLLDSCFIVELFRKHEEEKIEQPLAGQTRDKQTLRRDLLLIENQLPFLVVEAVLNASKTTNDDCDDLKSLAGSYFTGIRKLSGKNDKVHHLLHLYYLCLQADMWKPEKKFGVSWKDFLVPYVLLDSLELFGKTKWVWVALGAWIVLLPFLIMRDVFHILMVLVKKIGKCVTFVLVLFFGLVVSVVEDSVGWSGREWFKIPSRDKDVEKSISHKLVVKIPTATELNVAGTMFKRNDSKKIFSFQNGIVRIPTVNIHENSGSEFRNLIAFEQCFPDMVKRFTSYIALMNNLVDQTGDVVLLKNSGILETNQVSDENVVRLFSEIISVVSDEVYYECSEDVNQLNWYCERTYNKWRANLFRNYFSSPIVVYSLAGFFLVLVITVMQTVFTMIPVLK